MPTKRLVFGDMVLPGAITNFVAGFVIGPGASKRQSRRRPNPPAPCELESWSGWTIDGHRAYQINRYVGNLAPMLPRGVVLVLSPDG